MSRSKLLAAAVALPLMVAGVVAANANIIGLVIDGSGSISNADWATQKTGYANALTAMLNIDGSNSIGVWKFDDTVYPAVFAVQKIDSQAKKDALIAAILAMTKPGGSTAIGDAITVAKNAINTFNTAANCGTVGGCGSRVIDVSTDGDSNTGSNATTAANAAFATGIKVNCLGVGVAHCTFNDAAGVGQDFFAATTAQFEAVLKTKLSIELTPTPEPMTMSLFGAGLVGAGVLRRRKAAKTA